MIDKNDKEIVPGDVIDIHQTVNGQNKFVVLSISPLDVRYAYYITRTYEYDMNELLAPSRFTGETDFEIVGNINKVQIKTVTSQ